MTTLRASYWWAYGPLVSLAAVAPALLDQGSLDNSTDAWQLLVIWAIGSIGISSQLFARPVLATCLSFGVLGVVELIGSARAVELSFLDITPVAICLFATGALASRRGIQWVAGLIGSLTGAGVVVNQLTAPPASRGGIDVIAGLLAMALALIGGFAVRSQREAAEKSAQLYDTERQFRARAELEATRRERLRIAREMHDLVAHSVTLLVVNAETLRARRSELPGWAAEQADAMADAGRRAAGEMREMLHLLREADLDVRRTDPHGLDGSSPADDLEPLRDRGPLGVAVAQDELRQPGLADVPDLVAEARQAGMRVEFVESGTPVPLPPRTGLCVYRALQEALSNARRHGLESTVAIGLHWHPGEVVVEVASAGAFDSHSDMSTGLGLAGLHERAAELGGELEVTRTRDYFTTRVRLPLAGTALRSVSRSVP